MSFDRSAKFSGLDLLLEAAEYHRENNLVTPPCSKKRDAAPSYSPATRSSQLEPCRFASSVSATLPPKKRLKIPFGDVSNTFWLRSNPTSASNAIRFSPISIKKPNKCPAGSAHRIWERPDECAKAAISARHFNFDNFIITDVAMKQQDLAITKEGDKASFILHDKDDEKHINPIHNIVRRDIWEGFVVDISKDILAEGTQDGETISTARRTGRLARYDGTVGFRCRFCKHVPLDQCAKTSSVYPRSIERIYFANIRFQHDHIEHCAFIPENIKESHSRLQNSKGISRGRKQYWVSSALRKGLCNGEKGIVFSGAN